MLKGFFSKKKRTPIDDLITIVYDDMRTVDPSTEEYQELLRVLERLTDLKAQARRAPVSGDMIAQVIGNLLGIGIIVAYEQKHVLTSKGINEVIRPRIIKTN